MFKDHLKSKNLRLLHESFLEAFLISRMKELESLKISDFFSDMSLFSIEAIDGFRDIFCRCLHKITALLAGTFDKIFNLNLYRNTVLRVFDVIHESGFELEEVDETQEILIKLDDRLSEKNNLSSCSIFWPTSNFDEETETTTEQVVFSLDFHKIQDSEFRKKIENQTEPRDIWRRKKIHEKHQMDTLLRFRKVHQSTTKDIFRSSILKKRMVDFLCFLFPKVQKWTKLVHFQTDLNSREIWKKECSEQESTVVLIRSGEYISGGFNDKKWNFDDTGLKISDSFLFSMNKKIKYPLCQNEKYPPVSHDDYHLFGFGFYDIKIKVDFRLSKSYSDMSVYELANRADSQTELFGSSFFLIDEIEIFKIQ